MGTLQEIEDVMRKTVTGFSTFALRDHKLQIARGKATTGDQLLDYLVFDSDTPEELRERERSIKEITERLAKNVGEEMLVGHQGRDYMSHTYPGTFSGEHTYWSYELARIKTGDFEVKMEVYNNQMLGKSGKAELILPVDGYAQISDGMGFIAGEIQSLLLPAQCHSLSAPMFWRLVKRRLWNGEEDQGVTNQTIRI